MMYPLVRDLAAAEIPVTVTCRLLGFSKPRSTEAGGVRGPFSDRLAVVGVE